MAVVEREAELTASPPPWTVALRRVVRALRLVTVALLLVAMARPQTGRQLTTGSGNCLSHAAVSRVVDWSERT